MGPEGETKYKGKVVHIRGKVDIQATKRPAPGGTTNVVMEGDAGEPPHAIVTIGQDSEQLLFGSRWQPAQVSVLGVYRGRDPRGTILVDEAVVVSLTSWLGHFGPRRKAPKQEPKKPAGPIVITAERLSQELYDDINAAYRRYGLTPLEVEGTIAKQSVNKGAIVMVQFQPPIKDRKTGKPVEWVVFCALRPPVPVGAPGAADLAVGKKVKLRGTMVAAGNGQATLSSCDIVRE
jgi:hypothetical protein